MSFRREGAENEMREVNDRIYAALVETGGEDGDFICECGDQDCYGTVQLTLREYAAIQTNTNPVALRAASHAANLRLAGLAPHRVCGDADFLGETGFKASSDWPVAWGEHRPA